MVVLPTSTAPASLSRAAAGASRGAGASGRSEGRRHAGGGDVLLDRDRHAVDRAERLAGAPACLGGAGLSVGLGIVAMPEGVDRRLPCLDPGADGRKRLARRSVACLVRAGEVDGAEIREVGHGVSAQTRMPGIVDA
jgi:hypothetical protein